MASRRRRSGATLTAVDPPADRPQIASLEVRSVPLSWLHGAPWNANRMTDQTRERVRRSLRDFGVVENLVARPLPNPCPECGMLDHLEVISGNHRLELYREEGIDPAPTHVVDLDDARARLLAETLNRTRGKDDPEAYRELLARMLEDLAPADITAFIPETEVSIARLVTRLPADPDDAPDPPAEPRSRRGEIYELGPHRLMCGDALDPLDVARLLDGAAPVLLVTDPPYGIAMDLVWAERQANWSQKMGPATGGGQHYMAHQRGDGEQLRAAALDGSGDLRVDWADAFTLVPSLAVAYVWHAGQFSDEVGAGLRRTGWDIAQQIIWDKGLFALSRARYHWQHEACSYAARVGRDVPWYGPQHVPAFYARRAGVGAPWLGGTDQSTVWTAPSPRMPLAGGSDGPQDDPVDHPTQKPVELYARPIRNHLQPGGWIYDPFVGSGTAIIAAELTGRRAVALDLDPAFCDVVRQRYATFTGRPELAPNG